MFFILTLFVRLYVRVGILLKRGNHLYDRTISLRGDAWAYKTTLSLSRFIVLLPSKKVRGNIFVC